MYIKKQEQERRRGWGETKEEIPKWYCQTERHDDVV